MKFLIFLVVMAGALLALQVPPPPPPPAPPGFMTAKGLPLACFAKPNFEEDGLEFFVCNGGTGLAGVRPKNDKAKTILVRNFDIAQNLKMQSAKSQCNGKRFAVSYSGYSYYFLCGGKELAPPQLFEVASATDWKRYQGYLNK